MLVHEFLEKSAQKFPDKTALICGGQRLTFLEIETEANRLANAFRERGLGKQERIAIFLEPSVEAVVSVFGALKAGGVFAVINPQVKAKKLSYILNDCQAKILVTDASHLGEIAAALPDCHSLELVAVTDFDRVKKASLAAPDP
ncbi:MAG: AMP-binding protein, partial [Acidobacteriota bacterium]